MAAVLVFQKTTGVWSWHLETDDGALIATDGTDGYPTEEACSAVVKAVVVEGVYADAQWGRRALHDDSSPD